MTIAQLSFSWLHRARDDSLEGDSKVHVENGVNNGVEGGVDVTKPSDKTHYLMK